MVDMNSDHILEVPDTPDRIPQSTYLSSGSSTRRGSVKLDANPSPSRRIIFRNRNASFQGRPGQGNVSSVTPAPSNAEHLFRQAELARLLSEDLETKSSSLNSDRTAGASVEHRKKAEKIDLNKSSSFSISNHASRRDTGGRSQSCQTREVEGCQQGASQRNADFLGVGSSLPTISVGRPRTGTTTSLKQVMCDEVHAGSNYREEDNGKVIHHNSTGALSSPSQPVVPQRHVGQRKLVRNGCISPCNIAKISVQVDKKQESCSTDGVPHHSNPQVDVSKKGNVIALTDNSLNITEQGRAMSNGSISANNMETRAAKKLRVDRIGKMALPEAVAHEGNSRTSCSKGRSSDHSNKGKEISHDDIAAKQTGKADLSRVCPRVVGDCAVIANNDRTSTSSDDQGWRTTHNHINKLPISRLCKAASSRGRESGSTGPCNQNNETAAGENNNSIISHGKTTEPPPSLEIRRLRIGRGKRKSGSSSYHFGESSSSVGELEISYLGSSNATSDITRTSHRPDIPIVEVDDIRSPEVRRSGSRGQNDGTFDDPNARAQLESDELLARRLQEQLYNESPRVDPTEEIDAIIAMSLQHEEDAQQTSRVARRYRNNIRGAQTSRRSTSQRATRAGYETASTSISHLRNIVPTMNMHLRAFGEFAARIPSALQMQHNIDINDYDALLALDENNHQHTGASESHINNLPQSVVQSNSIEEPCAVCLENPSIGDTIRHLPCLHKFHKECIDEWLRRKKLCPVCKSGIT